MELFDTLVSAIGNPIYASSYGMVFNCDCIPAMASLPEGCIDLTFTSPPYNIGKEYERILAVDEYVNWSATWMREVYRITKAHGSFWLNVGYMEVPGKGKAVPLPYFLWNLTDFYLQQEIVWNYGAGVASRKRLSPRNEKILWFTKDPNEYTFNLDPIRDKDVKYPNQKKNGKLRCNTLGKNPSDVWQIAKVTSGRNRSSKERAPHPAQTPLDLLNRILLGGSNAGDIVCDPFLGSGSTAVSCIANDRFFIGFEINETYCHTAISRIEEAITDRESRLFQ